MPEPSAFSSSLLAPETLAALKRELFSALHCALPGTVVSFDPERQTAEIRPADTVQPSLPLLRDVPVFMPVPFSVSPGDACLVIFADCDIDTWLCAEGPKPPISSRRHALSDGFAFVGFRVPGKEVSA